VTPHSQPSLPPSSFPFSGPQTELVSPPLQCLSDHSLLHFLFSPPLVKSVIGSHEALEFLASSPFTQEPYLLYSCFSLLASRPHSLLSFLFFFFFFWWYWGLNSGSRACYHLSYSASSSLSFTQLPFLSDHPRPASTC
jgi:hypothetical protein